MESQQCGTPVVGADIGGIPELITNGIDGRLFESKNKKELADVIKELWYSPDICDEYARNCLNIKRDDLSSYCGKLLQIYEGGGIEIFLPVKFDYVLYFGRFSKEKGIRTLIEVCKELPNVNFVFAGTGPLESEINGIKNIKNVGFQTGIKLQTIIREARFSVYPSEWYENCPFSVMESQMYGTPVVGADIGGIPELIKRGETGVLFESGNIADLKKNIRKLWDDQGLVEALRKNCGDVDFADVNAYGEKLLKIYSGDGGSQ